MIYCEFDVVMLCIVVVLCWCGVWFDILVVLCVECLFDMVMVFVGVLKVGVVYLLVDFDYLVECIVYLLCDVWLVVVIM